jgi:uncharacterized membrane protein
MISSSSSLKTNINTIIPPSTIESINIIQQQNGYDCGVHVLTAVEALLSLIHHDDDNNNNNKDAYSKAMLQYFATHGDNENQNSIIRANKNGSNDDTTTTTNNNNNHAEFVASNTKTQYIRQGNRNDKNNVETVCASMRRRLAQHVRAQSTVASLIQMS